MGKLKYFLFFLCGIFAFSLISCHDSFALEVVNVLPKYDSSVNGGSLTWDYTQLPLGSVTWEYPSIRIGNPFPSVPSTGLVEPNPFNRLSQMYYHADKVYHIRKGSRATLSFVATTISEFSSAPFMDGAMDSSWTCPTGTGAIAVLSCDIKASTSYASGSSSSASNPQLPSSNYNGPMVYTQTSTMTLEIATVDDFEGDTLWFSGQFFYWYRALWSGYQSGNVVTFLTMPAFSFYYEESTSDTIDRVHEEDKQQREEDEKKAQQNSNDSQSSSDDSQKQADDASKNLFQILTEFVSAITSASPSSCSISGDFGFFNVGSIDLCSGAGKIRPITTVIGTIMLIGFTIPAVIVLLHRFVDLYNEVMS